MDFELKFYERLDDLIKDANLDAKILSDLLGIDRSVIYKYLRNEVLPTLENLLLIADYFQCSIDYLLGKTTSNPETKYKKAPKFCERLKFILDEKGIKRYKLRKDNNFARQSVEDWYYGRHTPGVDSVITLAKYFNCSIDYLLGRE